ncbi:MAG: Fe-S cluster assembly protein SufD [Rhizobiaceae bacterium]|nr:Fe-S cluster assembly protein SufD [Rhizobiaceae bacterium]
MNMHAPPQRTVAETALVDAFGVRLSDLPGDGAVTVKRDAAIEQVKAGLPTRHVEAWHYTDLRRLLTLVPPHDTSSVTKPIKALLAETVVLPVLNGVAHGKAPVVEGVTLQRVSETLAEGSCARALGARDADDTIGAINSAFVTDGWFVDVAPGTAVAAAFELQNVLGAGQAHVRFPVRVGDGASVTIVERQSGAAAAFSTSVANLLIGRDATVRWLIVQDLPDTTALLSQFNAEIGEGSSLSLFLMNEGGKLVRQEVRVDASGQRSDFQLRGVNLLSGDTHTDVTMVLDHSAPNAGSRELIRNVVTGKARGVFQGRINVHQIAQKTDAKMACNTLLLSDDAEFSAKPELEIFADDVQCGHGATVTEINANHLFYLKARGVDDKSARGLLVKAFVAEAIEQLDDEAIVEALEARLEDWFATHG